MALNKYSDYLKELYSIDLEDLSFRDAVGRYSRVYGKENLNEKKPLDIVHNERAGNPIKAVLKLFNLYGEIKSLEELAKRKKEEHTVYKNAQRLSYISKINKVDKVKNEKMLIKLNEEKFALVDSINNNLLDLDSSKTEEVLLLKTNLSSINRRISKLRSELRMLQVGHSGNLIMTEQDRNDLMTLFPNINIKSITEVEAFHREMEIILNDEINNELTYVTQMLKMAYDEREDINSKIKSVSKSTNLSDIILFKLANLQSRIDKLQNQNQSYDKLISLGIAKKDTEDRRDKMRKEQLIELERCVNDELEKLNDEIYNGLKKAPNISFDKNQYTFETVDDTGTGTSFKSMVLFDIVVLRLTSLPVLIHDSVVLKQIEDFAIEKLMELYTECNKQVFIAFDKLSSYTEKSQVIIEESKVLELAPNGNELFGVSWNKK